MTLVVVVYQTRSTWPRRTISYRKNNHSQLAVCCFMTIQWSCTLIETTTVLFESFRDLTTTSSFSWVPLFVGKNILQKSVPRGQYGPTDLQQIGMKEWDENKASKSSMDRGTTVDEGTWGILTLKVSKLATILEEGMCN